MKNDTLGKSELAHYIVRHAEANGKHIKKSEAENVIELFTKSIIDALSKDAKSIKLIGFGTFTVKKREAKTGFNPRTKKPMDIPPYNQILFRVGADLKKAANLSLTKKGK